MNSGNVIPNYIKLVDGKGKPITDYRIKIGDEFTNKKIFNDKKMTFYDIFYIFIKSDAIINSYA